MIVHRKKRPRYKLQMPLTSLIDIVFLLLIYFLLTTNFMVAEGINVSLPQAQGGAPQTQEDITVYVDREGRAFLLDQEVPLDQLLKRLREMIGGQKERLVIVKADRSVILNKAVRVMDLAKAAGAGKLCLATEKGF
ncbi:MAG: biopolymer transporter ExbD [Deltaproteobacteria bacterium]|nr:biopolymer transporter ExbD [Deltaproteobacteria bacterium]